MPQENNEATELEYAEEIGFVIFPTARSARLAYRAKADLDRRNVVSEQAVASVSPTAPQLGPCI